MSVVNNHVMGDIGRVGSSDKLSFPAAERNVGPIVETLAKHIDASAAGLVALEVASGGGAHVTALAKRFPNVSWQPTDVERTYLASVKAYAQEAGLSNVAEPRPLDVSQPAESWFVGPDALDLIFGANVLHITPFAVMEGLVAGALRSLRPGGRLVIYGPFAMHGVLEPESNQNFDASLRARDPAWGVRDIDDLLRLGEPGGLVLETVEDMPANNKMLFFKKGPASA